MRSIKMLLLAMLLPLLLAACATVPPPQPDPLLEQFSILRKQLLELQVLQNDTRSKLDEKIGVIETLTAKVNTLEDKIQVLGKVQGNAKSSTTTRESQVHKNAKKKRQVRRQE